MQFSNSNPSHDIAQVRLLRIVDELKEVLSPQYPIKHFVHHNSIEGYQHLPFTEAIKVSEQSSGAKGFLADDVFQKFYQQGRITDTDLKTVIKQQKDIDAELVILKQPKVTQLDVVLQSLIHGISAISQNQLNWQIDALGLDDTKSTLYGHLSIPSVSPSCRQGVDEKGCFSTLWQTCLEKLNCQNNLSNGEFFTNDLPEQAEQLLNEAAEQIQLNQFDESVAHFQLRKESTRLLDELLATVGEDKTLREVLQAITGQDIMDDVTPLLIKHVSAFLDQGFSSWHSQYRQLGFYKTWRSSAEQDIAWLFEDFPDWKGELEILPDNATDTVILELRRLGLDDDKWYGYLECLSQQLPGWSAMFLWRHSHPGFDGNDEADVDMIDYLAVRLVMERMFAQKICRDYWKIEASIDVIHWHFTHYRSEFYVRYHFYQFDLPEYLQSLILQQIETSALNVKHYEPWKILADMIWNWLQKTDSSKQMYSVSKDAWPLFCVCQACKINSQQLLQLDEQQIEAILKITGHFSQQQKSFIWLQAYENHYRDEILNALKNNVQKGRWPNRKQLPTYQIAFCMDDREEGFRRYLEATNNNIETFGAAGFFSIPFNWKGEDDEAVTKLCPVVVTPSHQINATVPDEQKALFEQHVKKRSLRLKIQHILFHETRRNLLSAAVLSSLFAPISFISLLLKMLVPKAFANWLSNKQKMFDIEINNDIDMTTNDTREASTSNNKHGFTDDEQTNMVATLLTNMGINKQFAKLFVLMGHDSTSVNNPHLAGYSCGACSGRSGGPNARLFARMANRPTIRKRLLERNIIITDDTWFIGAEHLTSNEKITWFDEIAIPENFKADLQTFKEHLYQARLGSSHERCRRMESAPQGLSLKQAYNHVVERTVDISQARPELGHATNACAFIGRRSATEGVFFDRRMFLISYDAAIDPTGEVVERLLLANGPVGAGINLEYYFSSVDTENYGCGSKVTHNISGNLGVMDGTSGDLKTGLPTQMTEVHEAMRLLVIVEATTETLGKIYGRQTSIQELVGNGWINLVSMDPITAELNVFEIGKGFVPWHADEQPIPLVKKWQDYYDGQNMPLKPATIYAQQVGK